jgi:protein TonB
VVLEAVISKTGTVQNLKVISGPTALQQSAVEAVRTWKYKPSLLDGQPVEANTTVVVKFNLNSR